MRTWVTIVPTFWIRGSGAKLRGKPAAQVLALYFMTSPHSTMIGIYYESLTSILHETGLTEEQFRQALPEVSEIARYDEQMGIVFLPEGSCHQVGPALTLGDKKRKSVLSQLKIYGNHDFVKLWVARYYDSYNLSHEGIPNPCMPLREAPPGSPIEKPLRRGIDDSDPLHAPSRSPLLHAPYPRTGTGTDPSTDPREIGSGGSEEPLVASLQARAQAWVTDPFRASVSYPDPHKWSEMWELAELVGSTFGVEPDTLRAPTANGSLDGRVQVVLERWAEGVDQARMRQAVRGSKLNDLIASKPELQSLQTIFKDGNAVDKYCRLAKAQPGATTARSVKPKHDPDEDILAARKRALNQQALAEATPEEIKKAEGTVAAITNLTRDLMR